MFLQCNTLLLSLSDDSHSPHLQKGVYIPSPALARLRMVNTPNPCMTARLLMELRAMRMHASIHPFLRRSIERSTLVFRRKCVL
jgi:hypothetical protein